MRIAGAILLLASLLAQLGSGMCSLYDVHVYCSEHGAWEHARDPNRADPSGLASEESEGQTQLEARPAKREAPASGTANGHQACGFAIVRPATVAPQKPEIAPAAVVTWRPRKMQPRRIGATIPLLHLAPKSSPPNHSHRYQGA